MKKSVCDVTMQKVGESALAAVPFFTRTYHLTATAPKIHGVKSFNKNTALTLHVAEKVTDI